LERKEEKEKKRLMKWILRRIWKIECFLICNKFKKEDCMITNEGRRKEN